jgi:CubicO group peptidase (beta-lactamase class C family)
MTYQIATNSLFTAPSATELASLGLSSSRLDSIKPWMQQWVDSGRLPFLQVLILRGGNAAFYHQVGMADVERKVPVQHDTLARYYSMTKPLTTVAAMMLYEQGRFQLDDPIAKFLPAFANMRVFAGGKGTGGSTIQFGAADSSPANAVQLHQVPTVAAQRQITFRDLMTHTSGLTYHFMLSTPVDALYRTHGIDFQTTKLSLAQLVDEAAKMPLLAQPGTQWNYGISTDVLGRLVEVISGQPFETYLQEKVLSPLGMNDTGFGIRPNHLHRFTSNYAPVMREGKLGLHRIDDAQASLFANTPSAPSGGGGLVSCIADYARFLQFMLNKGELSGNRLLGRKTVELMMSNHLKGDMAAMGQARFSESNYNGIGFGLGFSVMLNPAQAEIVGTPGEVAWGGAASTAFWIDPGEDMAVLMATQLTPSSSYPIRRELRVLSYSALV